MRLTGPLLALTLVLSPLAAPACTIAIDPGHSRKSPGATSARGRGEWLFNIELAKKLARTLQANGLDAFIINPEGDPIDLRDRPRRASETGAALLVSIHHDSVQPHYLSKWEWQGRTLAYADQFSGFGLFVSGKNPAFEASRQVSAAVADSLLASGLRPSLHHAEPIAGENRPLLDGGRGIYQYDDLVVLKYATIPALLLEVGVIVNREEELRVSTPEYQDKAVAALVQATAAFCGSTRR